MKVRIYINEEAAILAGKNKWGEIYTEINPYNFSDEERRELTLVEKKFSSLESSYINFRDFDWKFNLECLGGHQSVKFDYPIVIEPSEESVKTLLEFRIEKRRAVEKAEEKAYAYLRDRLNNVSPDVFLRNYNGNDYMQPICYCDFDRLLIETQIIDGIEFGRYEMGKAAQELPEFDALKEKTIKVRDQRNKDYLDSIADEEFLYPGGGVKALLIETLEEIGDNDRIDRINRLVSQRKQEEQERQEREQREKEEREERRARQIDGFVREHFDAIDQKRWSEGFMTTKEAKKAMHEHYFSRFDFTEYTPITREVAEQFYTPDEPFEYLEDVSFSKEEAENLDRPEYERLVEIRDAVQKVYPDAEITPMAHKAIEDSTGDVIYERLGISVKIKVGEITFVKEFAMEE